MAHKFYSDCFSQVANQPLLDNIHILAVDMDNVQMINYIKKCRTFLLLFDLMLHTLIFNRKTIYSLVERNRFAVVLRVL